MREGTSRSLYNFSNASTNQCHLAKLTTVNIPFLAGYNAKPLVSAAADKLASLPPFVITCIGHVQNVTVFKAETTAGQTTVACWVILEQCSVPQHSICNYSNTVPAQLSSTVFVVVRVPCTIIASHSKPN